MSAEYTDDEKAAILRALNTGTEYTPQFDARFPNQNQTRNCWQNYVDYHKCIRAKGEDFPACKQFFNAYRSLCPSGWTNRWDEQLEKDRSANRFD